MKSSWWLLASAWCFVCGTLALGDDVTVDVKRLITQLDAPDFAERQEASRKLSEVGKSVFAELEKSAETGTREVATRAIEILRQHFAGGDDETRQSAKAALERLARSGNASAAQRAASALNPQPSATIAQQAVGGINPAMIPLIQQRGIQIQVGGGLMPNVVQRTSIRNNNGIKEIEVQKGDKLTKVKDVAAGGIQVEIIEKINGQETTRKIDAKDLDDLKKKDADAAQIYERYSGIGARAQAGAVPGTPAAAPVIPPDVLKRQIQSIDKVIERYKAQLPNDPNMQQRIASLERTRERYQAQLPKAEAKPASAATPAESAADQARKAVQQAAKEAAEAARKAAEPRDPFAP
jgi:hypothetical protein